MAGFGGTSSSFIQHKGSGNDPSRQQGPHAHSIPTSTRPAASRLDRSRLGGWDKVFVYTGSTAPAGTLTANDPPFAKVALLRARGTSLFTPMASSAT